MHDQQEGCLGQTRTEAVALGMYTCTCIFEINIGSGAYVLPLFLTLRTTCTFRHQLCTTLGIWLVFAPWVSMVTLTRVDSSDYANKLANKQLHVGARENSKHIQKGHVLSRDKCHSIQIRTRLDFRLHNVYGQQWQPVGGLMDCRAKTELKSDINLLSRIRHFA